MNEHGSGALALTVALMTSSTVLLMPWASMYSCAGARRVVSGRPASGMGASQPGSRAGGAPR